LVAVLVAHRSVWLKWRNALLRSKMALLRSKIATRPRTPFVVKLMLLAEVLVAPSAFVHTRFAIVLIVRITELLDCLGWMSQCPP
jgi:uncharacterized membrane protein